jgi:hypothetical protein
MARAATEPGTRPATTVFRLSADTVAFYYDRFSIKADGNVRVDFGNGTVITGQTLVMDFRSNRMLVAGSVHLASSAAKHDGAAFADFFDDNRSYFISFAAKPERWTFADTNFTNPDATAAQPSDAFTLPDFSMNVPVVLAKRVTIGTRSFMRYTACRVAPVGGVRAYIPFPGLYVNFSNDPNLAQTTLAAANAGAKVKLTGSANATTALAINYATTTKLGVGFEQNFISQKGWADFSAFPLNGSSRFFSAVVSDAPSNNLGFQASSVLNTYPSGSGLPTSTSQFSYVQLTQSLTDAYVQLNYRFANSNLFAVPPDTTGYSGAIHLFAPAHPSAVQLGINTSNFQLGRALEGNARFGYGFNYNSYGLQQFGGVTYTTIWTPYAGLSLFTPPLRLGERNEHSAPYFVLNASGERRWNSLPHYLDEVTTAASFTKPFHAGSVFLGYSIDNVKDVYGAAQREAYPVIAVPQAPGYAAFQGFATFRTLTLGTLYSPNPFFALAVAMQKNTNFPVAVPALFTPTQSNVLGVNPAANYLGQAPYALPINLRVRVNPSLSLNAQTAYYFNFAGQTWNGFQLQFLP